jgi:hypothetical protein
VPFLARFLLWPLLARGYVLVHIHTAAIIGYPTLHFLSRPRGRHCKQSAGADANACPLAQAGAAHVYAVDASRGAADLAARVVKANNLQSRITVIHGRAEAVALPVDKVDAIVCDWMGAALLHDSLLPALSAARDR